VHISNEQTRTPTTTDQFMFTLVHFKKWA